MACQHLVSRWFIYFCLNLVEGFVTEIEGLPLETGNPALVSQVASVEDAILMLYLDCEASLSGIQRSLSDLFGQDVSIGYISQTLNRIGSQLRDTDRVSSVRLCLICDEIFGTDQPVVVVVDSESYYLLQLRQVSQRDKETWGICWLEIVGEDGRVERITADMGTGLVGGISLVFPDAVYQSDLLHVLMPLASLVWKFERQAYAAISVAYDTKDKAESSKYAKTKAKYEALCSLKDDESASAVDRYDDYSYLFGEMRRVLQIVDEAHGCLRSKVWVRGEIEAVLDLMMTLDHGDLKERVRKFRSHLDTLLRYFDQVENADRRLKSEIPSEPVRQELIRLYAFETAHRSASGQRKKRFKTDIDCWKAILTEWLSPERFKRLYQTVKKALSVIIRSSSMVENINSRLRRFFDAARGQLSQNRLNLIRFYLNHKIFTRGPRKGTSPRQMFCGGKTGDWLTELKTVINW